MIRKERARYYKCLRIYYPLSTCFKLCNNPNKTVIKLCTYNLGIHYLQDIKDLNTFTLINGLGNWLCYCFNVLLHLCPTDNAHHECVVLYTVL